MTQRRPHLYLVTSEPVPVINTTPLIDLMLVLLVMFIVSVPIATHKVPLDVGPPVPAPPVPFHRIDLDAAGSVYWDGRAIAEAELAPRLARLAATPDAPELQIAADGATRYERVDETLAAVHRAGISRMGFVGNERFADTLDR